MMQWAHPLCAQDEAAIARPGPEKALGLDTVIAFYGVYPEIASQTVTRGGDWRYWTSRGGVVCRQVVHYEFLKKNVREASDFLAGIDFGDNPKAVISIDEFGWDYDGGIDTHCEAILNAVHGKRPGLNIAVWQMRGPVAPRLASVYRKTVSLVMLETYVDLNDAWMIPFQLQASRLTGILDISVVGLGLGQESEEKGAHRWTQTEEELDQQIRLIRMVAPESPGVAFFGKWKLEEGNCPLTDQQIDAICGRFSKLPTDGTGLQPELLALGNVFTKRYEKPAIFCSSEYMLPNFHSGHDGGEWGTLHEPHTTRVLMMNLGHQDAKGVTVRVRNPGETSEAWAAGEVDIPARTVVIASLPVLPGKNYGGWIGTEILDVEAPEAEIFNFIDSRFHGKGSQE